MSEIDDETHRTFLEENHAVISAIARGGFRSQGRGAVFMFEDVILAAVSGQAANVTMEYVADESDALARRGGWPTPAHAELIRGYDPDAAMVILVARRVGGRDLFTHHVLLAPEESNLVAIKGRHESSGTPPG
jgi:hypothetical protein